MYIYVLKQFELDSTLHPFFGIRGGGGEGGGVRFVFCVFLLHDTFPEPEPGRAAGQIQSNPIISYPPYPHIPFPISHLPLFWRVWFTVFTVYGLRFVLCLFYALQGTGRMDGSVRV